MPLGSLKIQIEKDMNDFMTGTVSYVGTMILSNEFFINIKNIDRFA